MTTIAALFVIRVILFFAVAWLHAMLAFIHRAYWYQVAWVVTSCVMQVAFYLWLTYTEVNHIARDPLRTAVWAFIVDIQFGLGLLVFFAMLIKQQLKPTTPMSKRIALPPSKNDVHRAGNRVASSGGWFSSYQRLVNLSQKRQRQRGSGGVATDSARPDG